MEVKLYNIVAIVNEGYSELVMDIAKDNGARGGTIIPANSSVSDNASYMESVFIPKKKLF